MQNRLFKTPNIHVIWNHVLDVLKATSSYKQVTGIKLRAVDSDSFQQLNVDGVFVTIGHKPETN